jgi:hypothetical protein
MCIHRFEYGYMAENEENKAIQVKFMKLAFEEVKNVIILKEDPGLT